MRALASEAESSVQFVGVGGPLMTAAGLKSLFPMSDIAVNGIFPVLRRLPLLLRRIEEAAAGLSSARPDVVVHIDAQDFNQRVAGKLKRLLPLTPLVGYVSPTVWAWRPGRAKKIAKLYNYLLAVLPFEPEVHDRLGGPMTTYVGHPVMERLTEISPSPDDEAVRGQQPHRLLILPGSRQSEILRLLPRLGDAVSILRERFPDLRVMLPVVPHLSASIEAATGAWPHPPEIVHGEEAKFEAFRTARAAIAASGTVTLELALAQVPTVAVYRVSLFEQELGKIVLKARYASLPNLVLDRGLLPEFIDRSWTGHTIAAAVAPLLEGGAARDAQLAGLAEVRRAMEKGIDNPSRHAARIVLGQVAARSA
jgi:lipid-A-disaccharide synthase